MTLSRYYASERFRPLFSDHFSDGVAASNSLTRVPRSGFQCTENPPARTCWRYACFSRVCSRSVAYVASDVVGDGKDWRGTWRLTSSRDKRRRVPILSISSQWTLSNVSLPIIRSFQSRFKHCKSAHHHPTRLLHHLKTVVLTTSLNMSADFMNMLQNMAPRTNRYTSH